jgi:hypothetical protein
MPANHSTRSGEPTGPQGTAGTGGQDESPEMGRVLPFEPRRNRPRTPPSPLLRLSRSPVEDVDRYARPADDSEDYRYRMRVNFAAIVVVGVLIWCGYWLFDTLAEMRKNQDCVLSGRTNCMKIDIPPNPR